MKVFLGKDTIYTMIIILYTILFSNEILCRKEIIKSPI
jgi:hypothetical protein